MKIRNLFYVFLFVGALAAVSPGQEKTISEAEFDAALRRGISKMEALPRKTVIKRTEYKSGKVSETRETVSEYLPPDKSRSLVTVTEGGAVSKTETISLKNAVYLRENGGKWVKQDSSQNGFGEIISAGVSNIKPENSYSVEEVKSGNKIIKIFTLYTTIDLVGGKIYTEEKTFIDDQGLIRKAATKVSHGAKDNLYSDEVITYEYNPKIKIKAPVIKS
jgi:hypothetical protein